MQARTKNKPMPTQAGLYPQFRTGRGGLYLETVILSKTLSEKEKNVLQLNFRVQI